MDENILLFEDDRSISETYKAIIQDLSLKIYTPKTIGNAAYFIDYTPKLEKFAFIIIDLRMPVTEEDKKYIIDTDFYNTLKNSDIPGWIWLKDVLKRFPNYDKKKVIIFSAFINKIPLKDRESYTKQGVKFIEKGTSSCASQIIDIIESKNFLL